MLGLEQPARAVAVALMRRDGESGVPEVLLVQLIDLREGTADPYVGAWVLPGGTVADGEHGRVAATAKVRAETGLDVNAEDLLELCELASESEAGERFLTQFYVADVAADAAPTPAPNESIRWMRLDEANGAGRSETLRIPQGTTAVLRQLMDRRGP